MSAGPKLKSPSTLVATIVDQIESLILNGDLKPGTHITERDFAGRLGVSRAPVREALRMLERGRLVEVIPNRGVFVREVSLQQVTDVFEIRAELSGIVARQATQNVTPKMVAKLNRLIDDMDRARDAEDADLYLALNLNFHKMLYSLADNRRVSQLDRDLGNELLSYRRRGLASGGGLEFSNLEHKKILSALSRGDAEMLERTLKAHILAGKDRFLVALHNLPSPTG